jgi:hypothetical protein
MTADIPRRGYHRHVEGPDARRCPRCGEVKPLDAFALPSDRVQGHCKPCRLAVTQEWRARHHDELLARRRAAYASPSTHRSQLHRRWWATKEPKPDEKRGEILR